MCVGEETWCKKEKVETMFEGERYEMLKREYGAQHQTHKEVEYLFCSMERCVYYGQSRAATQLLTSQRMKATESLRSEEKFGDRDENVVEASDEDKLFKETNEGESIVLSNVESSAMGISELSKYRIRERRVRIPEKKNNE